MEVLTLNDGTLTIEDWDCPGTSTIDQRIVTLITHSAAVDQHKVSIKVKQAEKITQFALRVLKIQTEPTVRISKKLSHLDFSLLFIKNHTFIILTSDVIGRGSFKTFYNALKIQIHKDNSVSSTMLAEGRLRQEKEPLFKTIQKFNKAITGDTITREINSKYILGPSIHQIKYWKESNGFDRLSLFYEKMNYDLRSITFGRVKPSFLWLTKISIKIAKGLRDIHDAGYIHRDIKEGNIMIRGNRVKIGDFDLCISAKKPFEKPGGTLGYAPPEIFNKLSDQESAKAQSKKWDMWSFGILLYQLFHPTHQNPPFLRSQKRKLLFRYHSSRLPYSYHLFLDWEPNNTAEKEIQNVILELIVRDPKKRLTSRQVVERLKNINLSIDKQV